MLPVLTTGNNSLLSIFLNQLQQFVRNRFFSNVIIKLMQATLKPNVERSHCRFILFLQRLRSLRLTLDHYAAIHARAIRLVIILSKRVFTGIGCIHTDVNIC